MSRLYLRSDHNGVRHWLNLCCHRMQVPIHQQLAQTSCLCHLLFISEYKPKKCALWLQRFHGSPFLHLRLHCILCSCRNVHIWRNIYGFLKFSDFGWVILPTGDIDNHFKLPWHHAAQLQWQHVVYAVLHSLHTVWGLLPSQCPVGSDIRELQESHPGESKGKESSKTQVHWHPIW